MRSVSRNLNASQAVELHILPPIVKSQLLLNITRHASLYSHHQPDIRLVLPLLHKDLLHLDLTKFAGITDQILANVCAAAPNLREFRICDQPESNGALTSDGMLYHCLKNI